MYAKITNGSVDQFPYTVGQLRRDNPNTSFPKRPTDEMLAGYGVLPVTGKTAPVYDSRTQKISQNATPHLEDGAWVIGWTLENKTQAEIDADHAAKADAVRRERNQLLTACDWTQVADAAVDKAAWATYRQALRDVPAQAGFPWTIDWPVAP